MRAFERAEKTKIQQIFLRLACIIHGIPFVQISTVFLTSDTENNCLSLWK